MTTAIMLILSVATEFSRTPGPRERKDGDFSGEQFLQEYLVPKYEEAKRENAILFIDLDNTEGYGTSFLEESFGGLQRLYPTEDVLKSLDFKSDDERYVIDDIKKYIKEANN